MYALPMDDARTDDLPRLLALDLDGTLLTSAGKVSPRTRRALLELAARGVRLLVCTGRPYRTAEPILSHLELKGYAALSNGALLYDLASARVAQHFPLEKSVVLAALKAMRRAHPEACAAVETVDGWFTEPAYYARRVLRSEFQSEPTGVGDLAELVQGPVIKLLFRHPEATSALLAEALAGHPVHPTWAFADLLEVSAAGVTKANALRWLCAEWEIPAAAVAAFGDQNNDKEMLAWAGLGVAMGNAAPEAKKAADFVTTSNDEDGVALVLERWLCD